MSDERYPVFIGSDFLAAACECTQKNTSMLPTGMWLFGHRGRMHAFDPPTQMQKDIWLGEKSSPGPKSRDERIKALRWYCFLCQTVQMP